MEHYVRQVPMGLIMESACGPSVMVLYIAVYIGIEGGVSPGSGVGQGSGKTARSHCSELRHHARKDGPKHIFVRSYPIHNIIQQHVLYSFCSKVLVQPKKIDYNMERKKINPISLTSESKVRPFFQRGGGDYILQQEEDFGTGRVG